VGTKKVLALCPCCEFHLKVSAQKRLDIEVQDLAHYVAKALRYDMLDPNPEDTKQQAVFKAMIALMTPQGFADLMKLMLPELMDAMPMGTGKMIKLMGKIPGTLAMMRPGCKLSFSFTTLSLIL